MSIIPKHFLDAVVSLGVKNPSNTFWVGTGFIVGRKEEGDPNFSTFYIVTNKHVVSNRDKIEVRFNNENSTNVKDYTAPLVINGKKVYSEHPNNNVVVIAIQINAKLLISDKSKWSAYDLESNTLTLEQMKNTGVDEGTYVYTLGFPMNLVGNFNNYPICRSGCISRVFDAFNMVEKAESFLVDAQAFPGNSGGPVINRPEIVSIQGTPYNSKANLIGILSAYIPYRDVLVSRQTQQETMILTENSGLTIVHPVDRIKEVVENEYLRASKLKDAKQ